MHACRSTLEDPTEGETGAGKDLVARCLHRHSERRGGPFIAVNCGAIPDSLFEAELFGHRKGAFTGAVGDKPGLVEAANGGTLFLDEIGELAQTMQVRLLRVLENGEVRRLGETRTRHVDLRVIAATNRQLREEAVRGRFRLDLFYRLNGAACRIPPLRERLDDLEALIEHWLSHAARRFSLDVRSVTADALSLLRRHDWPGNVRELRNVMEHAAILAQGESITEREVAAVLGVMPHAPRTIPEAGNPDERDLLLATLSEHRWRIGRAAASLGVSRSTLWRKLRRHGVRLRDSNTFDSDK